MRENAAGEILKRRLSEGILSFPATPFGEHGFDAALYAAHISDLVSARPIAIVAAGGAGEIFSVSPAEHTDILRVALDVAGDIPVIAGAGQGVAVACDMARAAERANAAAVLLFPPYLITAEQEGLAAYVEMVCRSVGIPVIAYSRDNGILAPDTSLRLADRCPNLIAIKDGTGDFEKLAALKWRAGDRLGLINGVPTAEIVAPQFFAMGLRSYTSAVFTFLPQLANRFFRALRDGESATVDRILAEFFVPLAEIRQRKRGYSVAIVKAGLKLTGKPLGAVRPPLIGLTPADEQALAKLIATGLGMVADDGRPSTKAAAAR